MTQTITYKKLMDEEEAVKRWADNGGEYTRVPFSNIANKQQGVYPAASQSDI